MEVTRETALALRSKRLAALRALIVGLAKAVQERVTAALRPPVDLDRMSPRLRRDAGIHEIEVERERQVRAPLIR